MSHPSPRVKASLLTTLGHLVFEGGALVRPFAPQLLQYVIDGLADKGSPLHRRAALGTLSQIIRATADAREPYRRYPGLLPTLLGTKKMFIL